MRTAVPTGIAPLISGGRTSEVMGIVNVTPDSFADGGLTFDHDLAVALGRAHFNAGARVVDVGGESTRPGASRVDVDEELRRTLSVVKALSASGTVSIDTTKEDVARRCIEAGASIINDVAGTLFSLAGELDCGYVAMHSRGTPETMSTLTDYDDVVAEVTAHCVALGKAARKAGASAVYLDPGIGFAKTAEQNRLLLASLPGFVARAHDEGFMVLVGTSRKRFLSPAVDGTEIDVADRLEGSVATASWAMAVGVDMVRVHDVETTVRAAALAGTRRDQR